MERPKHRRLILVGLALAAALFLLGRHWASEPNRIPEAADAPGTSAVQPHSEKAGSAAHAAAAQTTAQQSAAPTSAAATGFRGKIVDAVTRQPVTAFEVQLIRIQREDYTENSPLTRS